VFLSLKGRGGVKKNSQWQEMRRREKEEEKNKKKGKGQVR
jgi:hypothetical protein